MVVETPDDVMQAELQARFPGQQDLPQSELAIVCDDCFQRMTAEKPPEQFTFPVELRMPPKLQPGSPGWPRTVAMVPAADYNRVYRALAELRDYFAEQIRPGEAGHEQTVEADAVLKDMKLAPDPSAVIRAYMRQDSAYRAILPRTP